MYNRPTSGNQYQSSSGPGFYQRSSDVYGGFSGTAQASHNTRAVRNDAYATRAGGASGSAPPPAAASGAAAGGAGGSNAPAGIDRALVIGINYNGTSAQLGGCINDAKNALKSLQQWGFHPTNTQNFMMLTEEADKANYPTRANILAGMKWLVKDAREGDVYWFHFSGHGSQIADKEGDEIDSMDETICPLDYEKAGMITDDDIRKIMVDPLPKGVTLYCIFDCCHSGTMMDLRFKYDAKTKKLAITDTIKQADAFVLMISGCMDAQTSADLPPGFDKLIKESVGALSGCLYPMIGKKRDWQTMVEEVRKKLKTSSLEQIPQMEASRDFDITDIAFKYAFNDFVPPPKVQPDPTVPIGINRAVVIGVNYIGGSAPLSGCINDARSALDFLFRNGLPKKPRDSYVLLTEEKGEFRPTRKNILKAIHWLVKGCKPGETLWFHFSGHGTQMADKDGDEGDGYDESICPVDYEKEGMITDDEIKRTLVYTLRKGVTLYCIFDCCHSGTIMDLRFKYDATKKTMEISNDVKAEDALVCMISGCMSEQTSADLPPGYEKMLSQSVGALSYTLYPLIEKKLPWSTLIENVRKGLKKSRLEQIPQFESSRDIDVSEVAFRRVWSNS